MADPLTDLFRIFRLKSVVYYAHTFNAPWGMHFPDLPHAQFHVVLTGSCLVEAAGAAVTLRERDAVLFPNGLQHAIGDHDGSPRYEAKPFVQKILRGELPQDDVGPRVRLLSGHFEFDRESRHPIILELPDVIHASSDDQTKRQMFEVLLPILKIETSQGRPGSESIVERLAEIFLIDILRAHFDGVSKQPSLLSAVFDTRLAAAISVIQRNWGKDLSLQDLASAAGMSRSAFAEHFKKAASISPMSYLTRWRLLKGREMLKEQKLPLDHVALACGYRSAEGFSRAFKRAYGVSPTSLRPKA